MQLNGSLYELLLWPPTIIQHWWWFTHTIKSQGKIQNNRMKEATKLEKNDKFSNNSLWVPQTLFMATVKDSKQATGCFCWVEGVQHARSLFVGLRRVNTHSWNVRSLWWALLLVCSQIYSSSSCSLPPLYADLIGVKSSLPAEQGCSSLEHILLQMQPCIFHLWTFSGFFSYANEPLHYLSGAGNLKAVRVTVFLPRVGVLIDVLLELNTVATKNRYKFKSFLPP